MGKYTFIADYRATYPLPDCVKSNPPCQIAQRAPRLFKKGEVIDGTPKFASVQCIKEPCPVGTSLVGIVTQDNLTIPMNVLSPDKSGVQTKLDEKVENRDPWTGKIEWDEIFNIRNLFYLVLLVYLGYLFMKHVLPLAKKSFGKS